MRPAAHASKQPAPCSLSLCITQVSAFAGAPLALSRARLAAAQAWRGRARALARAFPPPLSLQGSVETDAGAVTKPGLLARERYVVMNRFQARDNAGPRFEKRWAERKSSLASLDGFRFFTLLRRVDGVELPGGGLVEYEEGTPDYMSMTVWETKKNFNSWRTGYAFKEAHGGGSIGGFLSAVVGSMMVLKTTPVPAMWDALIPITTATEDCRVASKNRDAAGNIVADGVQALERECFVAMNRFPVKPECVPAFEERWAARKSALAGAPGFIGFSLLRRDGGKGGTARDGEKGGGSLPDDKFSHSTLTVWASKVGAPAPSRPCLAARERARAWHAGGGTHEGSTNGPSRAGGRRTGRRGGKEPVRLHTRSLRCGVSCAARLPPIPMRMPPLEHDCAACLPPLIGCTLGYLCLCSDCGLAWGAGQG